MQIDNISPFVLAIPQTELDDLKDRLSHTRWPEKETVDDWSQGLPLYEAKKLIAYWRDEYDWRRCETRLNGLGQYTTTIDGVDLHFLHIRSPHEGALPLIMSHGWPGSVIEFLKVIGPLTDPEAYGGNANDAFHLVLPSLPGFGFSSRPTETGWDVERIGRAFSMLMQRLGYKEFVAQGGDWGSAITTAMGVDQPDGLKAIHINLPLVLPAPPYNEPSSAEADMLTQLEYYDRWESGYSRQQATRPQTIGYALTDSPAGQAAWIYEKFKAWTDCNGDVSSILSYDEILDNIMLYWLPGTAASSARLYWESFEGAFGASRLKIPTGCSIFPQEIYRAPRSWAEHCIENLIYWNEPERGGHFAAFEQPELFVEEVRNAFRTIRAV